MTTTALFEGEPTDPRLLGVGLTPSEAALLECEFVVLHEPAYTKLFALGIRGRSLTGRDAFDALHVEAVCFLHGGRFEFARNLRDPTPSSLAVIIPARDENDVTIDLAAWQYETDALATWRGAAAMLGEGDLAAPRLENGLRVYPNVADWLRAARDGLMILDAGRARWRLAEERLIVSDASFGRRLRDALSLPEPIIFVEKPKRAAA